MNTFHWRLRKKPTGVDGLDRLSYGGLPKGQATLLIGEAGTGKTVLALQIMANAVGGDGGGVYISFEESPEQLMRNVDSFAWGEKLLESKNWSIIDARRALDGEISGSFDIGGLLTAIGEQAAKLPDPWIVIDGIDQLLQYQPNLSDALEQIRQINDHSEKNGWTLLLSGKIQGADIAPRHLQGVEYMLPTVVLLTASVMNGRLNRFVRIAKYRGSSHITDEVPLVINDNGIQLPYLVTTEEKKHKVSKQRLSTGIPRIDELIGGGLYIGSSLLISGRPGTAKTTIAACIAESIAKNHGKVLIISFDEMEAPYVRNLSSVGIDLQPYIDAGQIRFYARSAISAVLSEHILVIENLLKQFKPECVVIDPISAILKAQSNTGFRPAVEWIIDLARNLGITTVMTALTDGRDPFDESTLGQASTISDTWISLSYSVQGGERNRSISVIKSRGTAHSNQQRELILSDDGIDLADVYGYGSHVLMGTARVQRQNEIDADARREAKERELRRREILARIDQARKELDSLEGDLEFEEKRLSEELDQKKLSTEIVKRSRNAPNLPPKGDGQ